MFFMLYILWFFSDVPPDGLIPDVNNLCAGFQFILTKHLCHRVQRAMTYVETEEMIPEEKRNLVRYFI